MSDKLKWGIIGTGMIAHVYARGLARCQTGQLVAVGSRSMETARKFAEEFGISRCHGDYASLIADPEVQAIYIATPHPQHAEWAIRGAHAGKHLLVEKPIGMNFAEASAMIEMARQNDVFLMEAFMYRCHPQTAKLIELIRSGAIGKVRVIQATFSFHWPKPFEADHRLTANAHGGGGILDVGGYPMTMARLIAAVDAGREILEPTEIKAVGHLESTGVDGYTTALLKFPGDVIAQCATGIQVNQENFVHVYGTEGHIVVPDPWVPAREGGTVTIRLKRGEKDMEEIPVHSDDYLYAMEADMVGRNIQRRQATFPAMTWDDTLGNARALDKWREQIGLVYEQEKLPNLTRPTYFRAPQPRSGHNMKYGRIPGIDKPVSRLGAGADFSAGAPCNALSVWDDFFERGGNFFDTAWLYGHELPYPSDAVLGHWVRTRGLRSQVVILGKGVHPPNDSLADLSRQLRETLERSGLGYLDLYMMHRDNLEIPVGEFIDLLNEHRKAGLIHAFGGSNWSLDRVKAANDYAAKKGVVGFSAVSNQFSLARMVNPIWPGCVSDSDAPNRQWYQQTQTTMVPWSSQSRGFFVPGVAHPEKTADADLVRGFYSPDNFRRQERAFELAAKKNLHPTQLALAYVLCQPFPTFPMIGPRQIAETRVSVKALDITLTPEEMAWLNLENEE